MAGKIIEAIVVTLCLPFYIAILPFYEISVARKVRTLSKQECPMCGVRMEGLKRSDIRCLGLRLALAAGAEVDWDRLPQDEVRCPKCEATLCIDRKWKFTSCNVGDHITQDSRVPSKRR